MNKKEFEIIENIIKENDKNIIGFSTKLAIVSYMQDLDGYEHLQEDVKVKLLDFIYSFWIESDLIENTLFDIVYLVFENVGIMNFKYLTYKQFEKIMNALI